MMPRVLLIAALSYLLGSIPFGYLLVRLIHGEDVRRTGSGNIGATNVSRRSPILGVLTLLLDAAKGAAAVLAAISISVDKGTGLIPYGLISLAGLSAVAGHIFPIWLKFRGGKGVATGLGSFVIIAPQAVLITGGIFVAVVALFRYVSLGSIVAVAAFPVSAWLLHQYGNAWLALVFMGIASLLIIGKHHQNIRRLLAGTENRIGPRRA